MIFVVIVELVVIRLHRRIGFGEIDLFAITTEPALLLLGR